MGPTCAATRTNPPAPATAPMSGIPVKQGPEDEEQHAEHERGHERREDAPAHAAGLPAPDDAAEERADEREPEQQERDHQHPHGRADDAATPGLAHGRSLRIVAA